jgi:hypothetical protein
MEVYGHRAPGYLRTDIDRLSFNKWRDRAIERGFSYRTDYFSEVLACPEDRGRGTYSACTHSWFAAAVIVFEGRTIAYLIAVRATPANPSKRDDIRQTIAIFELDRHIALGSSHRVNKHLRILDQRCNTRISRYLANGSRQVSRQRQPATKIGTTTSAGRR